MSKVFQKCLYLFYIFIVNKVNIPFMFGQLLSEKIKKEWNVWFKKYEVFMRDILYSKRRKNCDETFTIFQPHKICCVLIGQYFFLKFFLGIFFVFLCLPFSLFKTFGMIIYFNPKTRFIWNLLRIKNILVNFLIVK